MKLIDSYLHAIDCNNGDNFNFDKSLVVLEKILNSDQIFSRRNLGDVDITKGGWNGIDHISLCDYSRKDNPPYENRKFYKGYTAYEIYIASSLSLILNKKNIETIDPILMPPAVFDYESLEEMRYLGNHSTKRFSDMPDEVQVKNKISLDNLDGLTIPISYIIEKNDNDINSLKDYLYRVKDMLEKYNKKTNIYDLSTCIELNNEYDVDMVLKKINS